MGADPKSPDASDLDGVSVEDMMAARLAVAEVVVQGASRTNATFLEKLVAPVLSTGGTFEGVVEDVHDAVERIRATGVFKGADAYLDTAPYGATRVVFTVSERPLYQIRTGTSMRTSADRDASVEAALVWRNLTGRADTLRASATYWGGLTPPEKTAAPCNSLALDFNAPHMYGLSTSGFARAELSARAHKESGFRARARTASAGITGPLGTLTGVAEWREVCDVDDKASVLVRDQAGDSVKAALVHEMGVDRRDDAQLPTRGFAAKMTTEVAGMLGLGDTRFSKTDASAQVHVPIGRSGLSVALCARAGAVYSPGENKAGILDRFFLGGPSSFRGFVHRGVGPRESGSALGGAAYYNATAMISCPTPSVSLFHQLFGARVHAFASAGDVGEWDGVLGVVEKVKKGRSGFKDIVENAREGARATVGVGIAGDTALGRVEVNLCKVISMAPADVAAKTGVQVALSQEFA